MIPKRLNPFRRARYRLAIAKRKQRLVKRLDAQIELQRQQLWDMYINAPTYTEARRILFEVWEVEARLGRI